MNAPQQANRLLPAFENLSRQFSPGLLKRIFDKPVFIVSAPRSGSALLFETLARSPDFWTIGDESHSIFNALPNLSPAVKHFESGQLSEDQADSGTRRRLRAGFLLFCRDAKGRRYVQMPENARPPRLRFLEKTPRNALNIPFLLKVFPDARFIFLYREARQNISSIIEAWQIGLQDGSFITFPNLPGWDRRHWCMLLPPGWRSMNGRPFAEIAAFQWQSCNESILDALNRLPANRWTSVDYADFTNDPAAHTQRLLEFCAVNPAEQALPGTVGGLPLSKTTITPPNPDKWRRHEAEINRILPDIEQTRAKLALLPDKI